jgi:hypothetical protein
VASLGAWMALGVSAFLVDAGWGWQRVFLKILKNGS